MEPKRRFQKVGQKQEQRKEEYWVQETQHPKKQTFQKEKETIDGRKKGINNIRNCPRGSPGSLVVKSSFPNNIPHAA